MSEAGVTAVALYDFEGVRDDNLAFKKGDVIYVMELNESGWWKGYDSEGRVGIFPYNYVQARSLEEEGERQYSVMRAIADFNPGDLGDAYLGFKAGDLITIIKAVNENWSIGRLDEKEGRIPNNYVEETGERDFDAAKDEDERLVKLEEERQAEAERLQKEHAEKEALLEKQRKEEEAEAKRQAAEIKRLEEENERQRKEAEAEAARQRADKAAKAKAEADAKAKADAKLKAEAEAKAAADAKAKQEADEKLRWQNEEKVRLAALAAEELRKEQEDEAERKRERLEMEDEERQLDIERAENERREHEAARIKKEQEEAEMAAKILKEKKDKEAKERADKEKADKLAQETKFKLERQPSIDDDVKMKLAKAEAEMEELKRQKDALELKERERQLAHKKLEEEAEVARKRAAEAEKQLEMIRAEQERIRRLQAVRDAATSEAVMKKLTMEREMIEEKANRSYVKFQQESGFNAPPPPPEEQRRLEEELAEPMKKPERVSVTINTPPPKTVAPAKKKSEQDDLTPAEMLALARENFQDLTSGPRDKTPNKGPDNDQENGKKYRRSKVKIDSKFSKLGGGDRCKKCGKIAGFGPTTLRALDAMWHIECFTCATCSKVLRQGQYLDNNGYPYCMRCHQNAFGVKGFGFGGAVVGNYK